MGQMNLLILQILSSVKQTAFCDFNLLQNKTFLPGWLAIYLT